MTIIILLITMDAVVTVLLKMDIFALLPLEPLALLNALISHRLQLHISMRRGWLEPIKVFFISLYSLLG